MRSNYFLNTALFALVFLTVIARAQDTTSTASYKDSVVVQKNEAKTSVVRNLVYLSAIYAVSQNPDFYSNYFKQGVGVQAGIPLYTSTWYTVRFNLGWHTYQFDNNEYVQAHSLPTSANIKYKNLEFVSFLPDVIFHPMNSYWLSPYASVGVGMLVASQNPSATLVSANGKELETTLTFGNRYNAQIGAGMIVHILPSLNMLIGASYNREFLENNQPEDIFYRFKNPQNPNYTYIHYSVGLHYKLIR